MKKNIYIVTIVLSFILFSCQENDSNYLEVDNQEFLPDEVSKDVILIYSDSGRVKRRMEAKLIHKFIVDTLSYTVFPEGVFAQFYDKEGKVTSDLKAGYAKKYEKNEDLIFKNHVVITNSKKETFITEEIYLKGDKIFSDSTVFVKTPAGVLRGTSLEAPKDLSSWVIKNPTAVSSVNGL